MTLLSLDIESSLQVFVSTSPPNLADLSKALTARLQTDCVADLSRIIQTSPTVSVRALAATLLRTHQLHFIHYPATVLASALLERLPREVDPAARRAITTLITALQSRFKTGFLGILLPAVAELQLSQNPSLRVEALRLPCQSATTLRNALTDPVESVRNAALVAFSTATKTPDDNIIHLLPHAVTAVSHSTLHTSSENLYVPLYEAFTNLIEQSLFEDYFLVAFCHALRTFSHGTLEAATPALEFLIHVSEAKPSWILKHLLLDQMTTAACNILLTKPNSLTFTDYHAEDEVPRERSTSFLAMRLLDSLAQMAQFLDSVFSQAFAKVVDSTQKSNKFDSFALSGCFHIIAALSDGCSQHITSHAELVMHILLNPQYFNSLTSDEREASLEAVQCVMCSLQVADMPEELAAQIAHHCLESIISGMRHPHSSVRKSACLTLLPVLQFCKDVHFPIHGEMLFHVIAMLRRDIALEAAMAIKALAVHASYALVSSQYFQALLRKILQIVDPGSSQDTLTTTVAYEAAVALVKLCEQGGTINEIIELATKGLISCEPNVRKSALSFFTFGTNSMCESLLLQHGETVVRVAIELLEQEENVQDIVDASYHDPRERTIALEHEDHFGKFMSRRRFSTRKYPPSHVLAA